MKVRIICADSYFELERMVNDFLKEQDQFGRKVIDIKFSGSGGRAPYGTTYWSAMVIME